MLLKIYQHFPKWVSISLCLGSCDFLKYAKFKFIDIKRWVPSTDKVKCLIILKVFMLGFEIYYLN